MKRGLRFLISLALPSLAGCRALPRLAVPAPAPAIDSSVVDAVDLSATDALADGGKGDRGCVASAAREICDNGIDDDCNGFVDADDPACTPQLLPTSSTQEMALSRLILGVPTRLAPIETNRVRPGEFATFNRAFAAAFYIVEEGNTRLLRQVGYLPGGTGVEAPALQLSYPLRDVCIFNNELIVVSPVGVLHRFRADRTPGGPDVVLGSTLSSCASDGNQLYVAQHLEPGGQSSRILIFDTSFKEVSAAALPAALLQRYDRLLDFAWSKKDGRFYGLFANTTSAGTSSDALLDGNQVWPFSLDGAVGAPSDAGSWHGLGEFLP